MVDAFACSAEVQKNLPRCANVSWISSKIITFIFIFIYTQPGLISLCVPQDVSSNFYHYKTLFHLIL